MRLYELSETGRKLTNMFLEEEIDEQTLEDSRELIKAEIEVNGGDLIDFYNSFTRFLGTGTGDKKVIGDIDQQINRLRNLKTFYQKRFNRFNKTVTDCLLDLGVKTGQSNGIQTEKGILYLRKSVSEVKPDVDGLIDKYKLFVLSPLKLTVEEYLLLPDSIKERAEIKEIQINKELYEEENGAYKKQINYILKVM